MQTAWEIIRRYLLIWLAIAILLIVATVIRHGAAILAGLWRSVSSAFVTLGTVAILVYFVYICFRPR